MFCEFFERSGFDERRLRDCVRYFGRITSGESLAYWLSPAFWACGGPQHGIEVWFSKDGRSFRESSSLVGAVPTGTTPLDAYLSLACQFDRLEEAVAEGRVVLSCGGRYGEAKS